MSICVQAREAIISGNNEGAHITHFYILRKYMSTTQYVVVIQNWKFYVIISCPYIFVMYTTETFVFLGGKIDR